MKKFLPLILILIIAAFLRLYHLSSLPPALNWDEVSHGYNAYSLLKTGQDEWGFKLPMVFRAYGDYKLPLYIYLTSISVFFFGLNMFSVRLISVISGLLLVFLAYLICKKITKNEMTSLLSSFLVAVSPWSLFVSRIAVEANLAAALFSLGVYFLILWLSEKNDKNLIFTAILMGFSLHAYNSARILVPIASLFIVWLIIKSQKMNLLAVYLVIIALFSLPVIFQISDNTAKARYEWVTVIDQGVVNEINEKRNNSSLPDFIKKISYNKITYFIIKTSENYPKNFLPDFLFLKGGIHKQFSIPDTGLLYLVTVPFLFLGLFKSLKSNLSHRLVALWFFIGFIPPSITKDGVHVLRSLLILPAPMILTAFGIDWMYKILRTKSLLKGKPFLLILFIALSVSFGFWWRDYEFFYRNHYSWVWQYGYIETASFIKDNYQNYDSIYFTKKYGEPHEFVLFYWLWDPKAYHEDPNKKWDFHSNWYWVDAFGKFQFINDWEMKDKLKMKSVRLSDGQENEKILVAASPGNYPDGWKLIKTVYFLDGSPAFEILEK